MICVHMCTTIKIKNKKSDYVLPYNIINANAKGISVICETVYYIIYQMSF